MKIVIPLCGLGSRFQGYSRKIKPMIQVAGKEIIFHVLDSIFRYRPTQSVTIIINKNSREVQSIISAKYPAIEFVDINGNTRGAAESVYLGTSNIIDDILLLDGDSFYLCDIVSRFSNQSTNSMAYFIDQGGIDRYSYTIADQDGRITQIAEKRRISDYANTGAYYFKDTEMFRKYAKEVIDSGQTEHGEFYVSTVISRMISAGEQFNRIDADYVSLGTPEEVEKYRATTLNFLFDLDGTLVRSDHIYIGAWKSILARYNVNVDEEFFNTHIRGTSDANCIAKLVPAIDDVTCISAKKDAYFINHLDQIEIIPDAPEFIKAVKEKGANIAIVTNCNRASAEAILDHMKISAFVDLLIIGSECERSKPYPDPYLRAISYFESDPSHTIIFEDSKVGILSALNVKPKGIVGIAGTDNREMLENHSIKFIVEDYTASNMLDEVISMKMIGEESKIKEWIIASLPNIEDVEINENNLKGGYISEVLRLTLVNKDRTRISAILKMENKEEHLLSRMAKELDLYEREYYFYESIQRYVAVNTATFYGIVRDQEFNKIGLLLEDLSDMDLALNLNDQSIDVVLELIGSISNMHNQFYGKSVSTKFPYLVKNRDLIFVADFIEANFNKFLMRWSYMLTDYHRTVLTEIVSRFREIQCHLSEGTLTLCHGDFKSGNVFYRYGHIPYLIDWQYVIEGKGVQDIVFLLIESFEPSRANSIFELVMGYYYEKIAYANKGYSREEFRRDIALSICNFPILVTIWFGTIDISELNDKNFPFNFIRRLLNFIDYHLDMSLI